MNQHCPGSGGSKPAFIQHRLRLTGPQIMPSVSVPDFHPGVVIVTVSPPGRIALPGRNSHTAHGLHRQGGFLSAPSISPAKHRHRGCGAVISGLIGGLFITPVIDFQCGFFHGFPLNPGETARHRRLSDGVQWLHYLPGKTGHNCGTTLRECSHHREGYGVSKGRGVLLRQSPKDRRRSGH